MAIFCFNPVQKSGHIPTQFPTSVGLATRSFNPVQKSGHIPTRDVPEVRRDRKVLTPFKSPVISQRKPSRKSRPVFSFNPVQKSGHIPTVRDGAAPADFMF